MTKLFGTNGIRGITNEDMNSNLALGIGAAWGTFLKKSVPHPRVAIGTDVRISNYMLKSAITAGLLSTGCDVVDTGLVPTPTLQYTVKEKDFDSGVIITASHNPPKFNGLKFIASDGTEFSREQESKIDYIYHEDALKRADWNKIGKHYCDRHIQAKHRESVISRVSISKPVSTVVDCGNGTAWDYSPDILTIL